MHWHSMITLSIDDDSPLVQFKVPKFITYHNVCNILEESGCLMKAVQSFRQLQDALLEETAMHSD